MFKSIEEINNFYDEHLDSLRMSGVEFDERGVELSRQEAIEEFTSGS